MLPVHFLDPTVEVSDYVVRISPITHTPPPLDIKGANALIDVKEESSPTSSHWSMSLTESSNDTEAPTTPITDPHIDEPTDRFSDLLSFEDEPKKALTACLSEDGAQLRNILGEEETSQEIIQKYCCGGGCCVAQKSDLHHPTKNVHGLGLTSKQHPVTSPDNDAFRSLKLNLSNLEMDTELTSITPLSPTVVSLTTIPSVVLDHDITVHPTFIQPHPPYHVFSAPIHNARELTKPGAEKRTFHFDIDVTDYPDEGGVDFKIGGAIGICPPNEDSMVDDILDRLGVVRGLRDKPVILRTTGGRWPTIWGEDQPRELTSSRRELLTWCCDIQTIPPTKQLLRVLAEYASDESEKKILTYLVSAEGQGAFCDLRTGPEIILAHLLHAFPSTQPPLEMLFSVLQQLMPRFYSLSNDPCISSERDGLAAGRRLIEVAASVQSASDWKSRKRSGTGSGYLERVANKFIESSSSASPAPLRIPMFRGLQAGRLTKEASNDGPMLLIGAGVGMAPFRGFIMNRLKKANCLNKVWLLQGIRDSSLDELYQGEMGDHEYDIKRVVQSRRANIERGEARYVQEEVINQAEIVWFVINAVDGRVCVCGSNRGMGEGVWDALVRVAMQKGGMNRDVAEQFWKAKKDDGQYISETW